MADHCQEVRNCPGNTVYATMGREDYGRRDRWNLNRIIIETRLNSCQFEKRHQRSIDTDSSCKHSSGVLHACTPKGKEIKDVASFSKFKRYDDMSIFGHRLVPIWTSHFDNSLLFNNTYCQLNIFLIMNLILNIIKIDN